MDDLPIAVTVAAVGGLRPPGVVDGDRVDAMSGVTAVTVPTAGAVRESAPECGEAGRGGLPRSKATVVELAAAAARNGAIADGSPAAGEGPWASVARADAARQRDVARKHAVVTAGETPAGARPSSWNSAARVASSRGPVRRAKR